MEQVLQQQYISRLEERFLPKQRFSASGFPLMGKPLVYQPPTYNQGPMVQVIGANSGLHVPTYGLKTYDPLFTVDAEFRHLNPNRFVIHV